MISEVGCFLARKQPCSESIQEPRFKPELQIISFIDNHIFLSQACEAQPKVQTPFPSVLYAENTVGRYLPVTSSWSISCDISQHSQSQHRTVDNAHFPLRIKASYPLAASQFNCLKSKRKNNSLCAGMIASAG